MDTVLVPTDFKLGSLSCIAHYALQYNDRKFKVILFHPLKITGVWQDAGLLARRTKEESDVDPKFAAAMDNLKQRFDDQIISIQYENFYGTTLAMFKEFIQKNDVSLVLYDPAYDIDKVFRNSLDPLAFIAKSKVDTWCSPKESEHISEKLQRYWEEL